LEEEELVLSQSVDSDIPKDKYDAKKVSIESRDKPRLIDTFLKRLYENDASPLHHSFLLQINNLMKTTIYWDAALYENIILSKQFSPTNEDLERLITPLYTASELEKLMPENGKYKPIRDDFIPILQGWKRSSREGKIHGSNNRSTSYLDSNAR